MKKAASSWLPICSGVFQKPQVCKCRVTCKHIDCEQIRVRRYKSADDSSILLSHFKSHLSYSPTRTLRFGNVLIRIRESTTNVLLPNAPPCSPRYFSHFLSVLCPAGSNFLPLRCVCRHLRDRKPHWEMVCMELGDEASAV